MKKRIAVAIFGLLAFIHSCTINDGRTLDDSSVKEVTLLGTWELKHYFESGEEIPMNSCENNETISFYKDHTFAYVYYGDKELDTPCTISIEGKGTWQYTSKGSIRLDYSIDTHEDIVPVNFEISGTDLWLTTDEGESSYTEHYTRR